MTNAIFDEDVPLDYAGLLAAVKRMKAKYGFLQSFSIGKSVMQRSLPVLILGTGRPETLYVGGFHALEYITSMLLLKFAVQLCEVYRDHGIVNGFDICEMLRSRSVYIVPMLNPDGVEIHLHGQKAVAALHTTSRLVAGAGPAVWQANAHGVDLNHNFNAGFEELRRQEIEAGITGPAPTRYGGLRPESEPETRALCNLCRRMLFGKAFAFHSQGEEIYWRYGPRTPRNSEEMAKMLAVTSGYRLADPEGLAANGGFKDWFIDVFGRPGFTIEIGKGKNPLPASDLPAIYSGVFNMLLLGLFI